MYALVHRFFIELERDSLEWWENSGRKLNREELRDVVETLYTDEEVYLGGSPQYEESMGDSTGELSFVLEKEELDLNEDSIAFKKLNALLRRARLENVRRSIDRVTRNTVQAREAFLQKIFAETPVPKLEKQKCDDDA